MTYQIPEFRRTDVEQLLRLLRASSRVILTTHLNADGDGAGCEAALLSFLMEIGKEAWIVNPTPFPDVFRFLVSEPDRILDSGSRAAADRCQQADLCLVLDTGEKSRIGRVNPLVSDLPLAVVDHHPEGPAPLDGVTLRDSRASATGELVFDLVHAHGGPWTPSIVQGLYIAILTDTGSFRFSNATPQAHRVVAELLALGASSDGLYRRVYGDVPLRRYRLLRETLDSLERSRHGAVAWMTVPEQAFRALGCTSEDLEGMVDYPRGLEGIEVGLLFRQIEPGQVKVSLRSNGFVDVNALARSFGGGGHVRASGALIQGGLEEVRDRVVASAVEATLDPAATVAAEPEREKGVTR